MHACDVRETMSLSRLWSAAAARLYRASVSTVSQRGRITALRLHAGLGGDAPALDSLAECLVVPLVLLSVGHGKRGDRLIEGVAPAEVGGQCDAQSSVSESSQRPRRPGRP